ncbi:hypothetical protein KM176_07665 [Pseudooceanicola sp. CBS1P-1]|uniref:Uncharacterized protein n=1 Tax=Pseudooceanicola albus TaxID=2692189 RepID=A0A6L7G4N2_9RHOB|nr:MULTISPECIES: hypothetical protein [Pseudooceanicola]MBT9383729.1 hypothetical protein [Pseudooceanicola endophyticus]MXN17583.1 hypothetical protein [Pseudooceanicola albus]
MPPPASPSPAFNVILIAQAGRLQYEAALFAASLRARSPGFSGRLIVAEPQPGPLWPEDPRISDPEVRRLLLDLGAEITPFDSRHFGSAYPHGNKIEGLCALPDAPFVFFDSDTLILDELTSVPFDFTRPSASLRVEGSWPVIELYGPGYGTIWKSLYDQFGLDYESSLDLGQPDEYWRRYLYFNAGFFYHENPARFGARFLDYACRIRDSPPEPLTCQSLTPWLDQIALPLVIHALGGGRDALAPGHLDGRVSCHYRFLPLLYAREAPAVLDALEEIAAPNRIKKVLKGHEAMRRMIYQGRGRKIRTLIETEGLPRREQALRNRLKRAGFWMR